MLQGTTHIAIFYIAVMFAVWVIFSKTSVVDILIIRWNRRVITRTDRMFGLNYVTVGGILVIICTSLVIIALKDFRNDRVFFTFFGFFAFIALPVAIGFLAVYCQILRVGQYRIGDGVLLLLSCVMFAMYGVNLHDVLWCGVATDWFSHEVIGGYDLALFFTTFGISDPTRWSYRTFGIYMMMKSGVQLVTGSVALIKYFNLHSQNGPAGFRSKRYSAFGLLFLGGTLLGMVQFLFDSPWLFTDFQYYLGLFGGIVLVIFLFLKAGSNFE